MSDALSGVLGLALIVGLLLFYSKERRAPRRGSAIAPVSPATGVAADPGEAPPARAADAAPASHHGNRSSSPNWGMPIAYCLLLAGASATRDSWWGYVWQGIFFAIVALIAYSTFNPRELATARQRDPTVTATGQLMTVGVPYLVVPIAAWCLVVIAHWHPGIFVPAVPWAVLLLAGGASLLFTKDRA